MFHVMVKNDGMGFFQQLKLPKVFFTHPNCYFKGGGESKDLNSKVGSYIFLPISPAYTSERHIFIYLVVYKDYGVGVYHSTN